MRVLVINGPNLDLLGTREPEIYGSQTLKELEAQIVDWGNRLGISVETRQSNHEGEIIEMLRDTRADGIVLNAAALTHTSRAIADAIEAISPPVVEVHISNILERESWRAHSMIAPVCVRSIYGRGAVGYRDALRHLLNRAAMPFETIRYGPHDDHVGDLRRGGGDLIVLAHGGIWRHEYQRDTTESLSIDLARRGYDTWNIEYRRIGTGGGWPGSAQDVQMALDFTPQLGSRSGRVIVIGHSAGSHLLLWAAERTLAPVTLHIALAPLTDLGSSVASRDVAAPESETMLAAGAPRVMIPDEVETVIVHGDRDQIVPVETSVRLAEENGLVLYRTQADHFQLLDPTKPEWEWVLARLESMP